METWRQERLGNCAGVLNNGGSKLAKDGGGAYLSLFGMKRPNWRGIMEFSGWPGHCDWIIPCSRNGLESKRGG